MEIKTLSKRIQEIKRLRNLLELEYDAFMEDGKDDSKEADNRFRAGLDFTCPNDTEGLSDGANSVRWGLKQINEGIALLESAYRRSIRFMKEKPKDEPKEEDKKSKIGRASCRERV